MLEGTVEILTDISKSLKKINNQRDSKPYKKDNITPLDKSKKKDDEVKPKCKWKQCKSDHKKTVTYDNNGLLEKSNSYKKQWHDAKLEPWDLHGKGENSYATLEDYRAEVSEGASYLKPAIEMTYPQYHTQKHHLIPASLFKDDDYPTLKEPNEDRHFLYLMRRFQYQIVHI